MVHELTFAEKVRSSIRACIVYDIDDIQMLALPYERR